MAGALKTQTGVGSGRNWYGRGTQAASMSEVRDADVIQLAGARRPPGDTGQEAPVRATKPGEPGVTGKKAARKKPAGSIGKNPGETTGSTSSKPTGSNVTTKSSLTQGPATDEIPGLVSLAQKLGSRMTMAHLQAAQASLTANNYPQAIVHLSRAHETARGDGNVQLMNAIQAAHGKLRMKTP